MRNVRKVACFIINAFIGVVCIGMLGILLLYMLGTKPYVVLSGSMEPEIHTGSLVFVDTKYDFDEVESQDIIAYKAANGSYVTHRVINKQNDMLETKGDNNEVSDGFCVSEDNFYGLTKMWLPNVGYAVKWIQTSRGKIIAVTVIISLLLLDWIISPDDEDKEEKKKKDEVSE